MPHGIHATLAFLRRTRNEAAVSLLVAALDSNHPTIRCGALEILAGRREIAGHQAVIHRIRRLGLEQLTMLRNTKHRMHDALAASINSSDAKLCESASRAILALGEYQMFPVLIQAIERKDNRQADRAAATLLRLAKLLVEEAQAPPARKPRRDPFFARRSALTALRGSLDRFAFHRRLEVVEAFLMLVPHDNATLAKLLRSPSHPCYRQLLDSLGSSPAPGVMRLLREFLQDAQTPQNVVEIVAYRVDQRFLEFLLASIGSPASPRALRNMARLRRVAWLQQDRDVLYQLSGPAQASAVELAVASSIGHHEIFRLVAEMFDNGKPEGRRVSCRALADFQDPKADELVHRALEDPDAGVRAAAAGQVRQRAFPGVEQRLVALLDAESPEVRRAAGSALSEYNFVRYVVKFAEMSDEERRTAGEIVGKTDPTAKSELRKELAAPSPTQRQRAINMALAMQLVSAVADELIAVLHDKQEVLSLRTSAAEALSRCDTPNARAALQTAKRDPNISVRDAAEHSLASMCDETWLEPANVAEPGGRL